MIWVGGLIIILTIVALAMRYEARLVLLVSGFLMFTLSGNFLGAFGAFTSAMTHSTLVPIITTVMGFTFILKVTECDQHLTHAIVAPMKKVEKILIPGTVLGTAAINIALTSAAGVSAAVGAIMIPVLITVGVRPAMAASAVWAGTFGSAMSPGNAHNVMVSDITQTPIMDIVFVIAPQVIVAAVIGAVSLTVVAHMRKETKGYLTQGGQVIEPSQGKEFRVAPLKAFVPIFPLILLVLGSSAVLGQNGIGVLQNDITVPQAMFAGTILAAIVAWKNPQEITAKFFDGVGSAYGAVISVIVCALVFAGGITAIGVTGAMIDAMQELEAAVSIFALFGPFIVGALSGSGDAATIAFNDVVLPNAHLFGVEPATLGTIANIGGALGRTISPFAGGAIICATIAKVNPLEMSKRNLPGMLIASVVVLLVFL